jgi:hypothetical protein
MREVRITNTIGQLEEKAKIRVAADPIQCNQELSSVSSNVVNAVR